MARLSMFRWRKAVLIVLLLALPSNASAGDLAGAWEVRGGGVTIMRIELRHADGAWLGIWQRPKDYNTDGYTISKIKGPTVEAAGTGAEEETADLTLRFDDPDPGEKPDVLRFQSVDAEHAKMTFVGGFSLPLVRSSAASPMGPWDANREYVIDIDRPTNAEMTAIFEADQRDRRGPAFEWTKVSEADRQRRLRVQELLDAGMLQSGADYEHAAFVFQHGDLPADYLKAHLLAVVAVARGKPSAVWISAATLDRYLTKIGQPQVLGTQFHSPQNGPTTQEPYDRTLASDALRDALKVPSLADQELQRQRFETLTKQRRSTRDK